MSDNQTKQPETASPRMGVHLRRLVGEWEARVEKLKADYETNKAQQNKSIIAGRILELSAAICEVKQRCLANNHSTDPGSVE